MVFLIAKGQGREAVICPLALLLPYQTVWALSINVSVKLQYDKLIRESILADAEGKWCGILAKYNEILPSGFLKQVNKSLCLVAQCN